MFEAYRDADASLLIRREFSDGAAWHSLCDLVQQPNSREGFQANFVEIDDPGLATLPVAALARNAAVDLHCAAIFIADAEAIHGPEHSILCVDCAVNPGASFRVLPEEVWGPENNLRLGNMDFAEFANAVGKDGLFRGFPA